MKLGFCLFGQSDTGFLRSVTVFYTVAVDVVGVIMQSLAKLIMNTKMKVI